jgi:zinc protease
MTQTFPHARFERLKTGGMDVLLAPRPGSGLVAVATVIRRGSADERPGEHGLASFALSMLMRGTARRSSRQMAFDLESIGAMAGAEDGMDTGSLSLRATARVAPEALGILFEALREPAFDAAEHEIHRQETLALLRMAEDDTFGHTYREYLKAMFAGHGYGHPSEGEIADVEAIAPEDCRRWHGEAIRPETLLLVAVGDFEPKAWEGLLGGLAGDWRPEGAPRARGEIAPDGRRAPDPALTRPAIQQGFIAGGFRTPPITHPDYPALRLASAVLGEGFAGRLFTHLRDERSLAYALGAMLRPYRLGGHQVLYIGTKPSTIDEARAGLLAEAEALRREPVSQTDLDRARQYVIGKYLMGTQSLAQQAGMLAGWEDAAGDAALAYAWPDRLRAITAEQVLEAARAWWTEPTLAVLRPAPEGQTP